MKKNSNTKWKALGLILVFGLEVVYAGSLVIKDTRPDNVLSFSTLPMVGDWYYERHIRMVRESAEQGDISDMIYLHDQARYLGRTEDEAAALELIRRADSPSADLFLYLLEGATEEQLQDKSFNSERELMLLHARAMKENLRPPGPDISGEKFIQQSKRFARSLSLLLEAAGNGDKTAEWIIRNLYR